MATCMSPVAICVYYISLYQSLNFLSIKHFYIMNILKLSLATLALSGGVNLTLAQEMLQVTSVSPTPGVVAEVGAPLLNFTAVPKPNPECKQPARLLLNGDVISSISTGETNRLEQFTEGQSDNSIRLNFSTKKYTAPGLYTVEVPEGFLTFNEATDINAAYEFSYTILDASNVVFEPQAGYFTTLPSLITLTIPGVKEIINNKQAFDKELNRGGMNYFTCTDILKGSDKNTKIEGNTITWDWSSSNFNFMTPGQYEMVVTAGALTLVYEDGSTSLNPEYRVTYLKNLIPFPEVNILANSIDNQVYEVGDIEMTLPEGITFGQFMRSPSLFQVDSKGQQGERVFSWSIPTQSIRGSRTVKMTASVSEPFTTPGNYMIKIGKSSFSATGPFYDPDYFGTPAEPDEDDPNYKDPYEGHEPGDIIEAWNNVDYIYRLSIVPSPAEPVTAGVPIVSELSEFAIYFPYAHTLEFPFTSAAEEPGVYDKFWRKQKNYEVSFEIVKAEADPYSTQTDVDLNSGCVAICHITPALTSAKAEEFDVYVPRGTFICDIDDSRQLIQHVVIDPTLTGITAPEVAGESESMPETVTVVTMGGVTLLKDAPVSSLFDLPAGLYIINGQATMLK